jgi:hypothetical protein
LRLSLVHAEAEEERKRKKKKEQQAAAEAAGAKEQQEEQQQATPRRSEAGSPRYALAQLSLLCVSTLGQSSSASTCGYAVAVSYNDSLFLISASDV